MVPESPNGTGQNFNLSGSSQLKTPNFARLALVDDDLVVSTTVGTKTISGEDAYVGKQLIEASDGTKQLGHIAEDIGDVTTVFSVAEELCKEGVLYQTELLASFNVDDTITSLLETLLLSLAPSQRSNFASRIQETVVRLQGDRVVTNELVSPLQSVGCNLNDGRPDVIVFAETGSIDARCEVNQEWLNSEAVLLRVGLYGTKVEIGPVLTSSSPACLECLTTREDLNDASQELEYQTLIHNPSYEMKFIKHFSTRLVLQSAVEMLPAPLVGQIIELDLKTLTQRQARLLGVPGCKTCNAKY